MNRKKRLTALFLALALVSGKAMAAPIFPSSVTMPAFSDLSPQGASGGLWYDYASIKLCVEVGLMKGTGAAFQPGGVVTIAEVATIAARIHEKTGNAPLPGTVTGQPWYATAIELMVSLGIGVGNGPESIATRSDFIRMVSAVLPLSMTAPINSITTLPDSSDPDVLRAYNAGLLTGKDVYGTFDGDGTLTRAEMAAMVARIADPALRKIFSPAYSPQNLPQTVLPEEIPANELPIPQDLTPPETEGELLPHTPI